MKNYLIIGGSSGIGKSLVNILSQDNRVYVTYNSNLIESHSESIKCRKLDVLNDDIKFEDLPNEIHGLAYLPGRINLKPFKRIKPDHFMEDFQLQVLGAVNVIQTFLPNLYAAGNSSILLFSTVAVQLGFNYHSQVAVSKGAIEGLTRSLAAELAPKIRVNAIAPSLTNTPLAARFLKTEEQIETNAKKHPMQTIGDPDKIAELASFLLSEKSSWTTGQIIHADGGMSSIK